MIKQRQIAHCFNSVKKGLSGGWRFSSSFSNWHNFLTFEVKFLFKKSNERFFEALSNAHESFVFCNPGCDSDHGTPQKMGHSSITHSIALLHLFTHFLHNAPALLSLTPRSLHSIQSRESILEITMAPKNPNTYKKGYNPA